MHSMLCMLTQSIQMTYTFVLITSLIFHGFSIRKKFWESWDSGLFNHTIQYYICQHCQYKTRISNAFNAIYVNTVDTVFTPHSTLNKVLCKSNKHQCWVSTNIALNALRALIFILTVWTNKIPYSIHNSIALIFCIDHLDMPSCPFELQCRF